VETGRVVVPPASSRDLRSPGADWYAVVRADSPTHTSESRPRVGETTIEILIELVLQLLFEIAGQVVLEILVSAGWDSLRHSTRPERTANPALASVGHFLVGLCAGVVSVLIAGRRLTPRSPIPGVSLFLAPLAAGLVMDRLGALWEARGADRPALFSFRAGAICAFGMALVRFVYLETDWSPF